eukprot:NODE_2833_length_735_cov_50.419825_g1997_i0.p2 GENE.NODE_2833_length_735_cov_50.419825_g1997_i0~~NODE_2833_length_735_cov_50.419825_g1997_i0.p2  ORF type:complete len:227 (-),score=54.77 NODE_2833_length_735_cov_50.419825_g1997_i0:53-685(-)
MPRPEDKSLDDIIAEKLARARRAPAPGPIRRDFYRPAEHLPYPPAGERLTSDASSGVKVQVSGLDPNWESEDVKEIFTEQGFKVRNVYMQYDRSGRSRGRCELSFGSLREANDVVQDMDGAEVDGFPLNLTRVSTAPAPMWRPPMYGGAFGGAPYGGGRGFGGPPMGGYRGGGFGFGDRGRRGGRGGRRPEKSKEELDRELAEYERRATA